VSGAPPPETEGAGALLHVGCGHEPIPDGFSRYVETRLDIDPRCDPDIVASMTDLGDIGPFALVYSSHSLEHLSPHEAPVALAEFRRVLVDGGAAVIMVPDLEGVSATDDQLFVSPAGPVCGLDLIYGFRAALGEQPHMAHRTGFIATTLKAALEAAGFRGVVVERLPNFNLMAVAHR
jgi:SAM-dependent methyltransferase